MVKIGGKDFIVTKFNPADGCEICGWKGYPLEMTPWGFLCAKCVKTKE